MAIKSFKCKHTAAIFQGMQAKGFATSMQPVALRKLKILDRVARLEDLRVPPGNQLEALKGNRKGQYSIRINDQWRICFIWTGADAERVEIVDYH